jgi:hypothetical protein
MGLGRLTFAPAVRGGASRHSPTLNGGTSNPTGLWAVEAIMMCIMCAETIPRTRDAG